MREYVIVTDSSCDLPPALAQDLAIEVVPLTVLQDGKSFRNFLDEREIAIADFYRLLREGKEGSTSAVNVDEFAQIMEPHLQAGRDVLYLGFSSGLSATYQAGTIAAEDLNERYDAKVCTVDTLCASAGQGLIVYLAVQEQRKGKTMEEVRDYVEAIKLKIAHWVTVDDLHHLKRGGRVSPAAAVLGSALNIKPTIYVDDEGKLIPIGKVRGRKNALKKLCDTLVETGVNLAEQTIFISHGDCREDADYLAQLIRNGSPVQDIVISYIGPVIGSHSGPGTVALFFVAAHR